MDGFSHCYHGQQYCSWARTQDDDNNDDDGGVEQHGGHTPNNRLTCSLGLPCTSLILDIPVMINWHLSKQGICWPVSRDHIAGLILQLIEVVCFLKCTADHVVFFSIGSLAHVRLTCWKQGRIVWKPISTSPGLKFIWIITFSSIQMFFLLCFVYMVIIKLKTEGQTRNRKPHRKIQSNWFYLLSFLA